MCGNRNTAVPIGARKLEKIEFGKLDFLRHRVSSQAQSAPKRHPMMMRGIAPPPLWVVLFFFSSPCTPFSPPLKLPVPSSVAHFSQTERIPQYFSRVRTQAREHATVMQLKEDSSNAWSLDKSGMTRRSAIASFLLGLPLAATAQDMATLGITTGSGVDAAPVSPLCDQVPAPARGML